MNRPEEASQRAVVEWWAWSHRTYGLPEFVLYHIPNGSKRSKAEAGILKSLGVRAGLPDLFLSVPVNEHPGLYLEMKAKDGALSPEQAVVIPILRGLGYVVLAPRSATEAIEYVDKWAQVYVLEQRKKLSDDLRAEPPRPGY